MNKLMTGALMIGICLGWMRMGTPPLIAAAISIFAVLYVQRLFMRRSR